MSRIRKTGSLAGQPVEQPYLTYRPARLDRPAESIPGLLHRFQIRKGDPRIIAGSSSNHYRSGNMQFFHNRAGLRRKSSRTALDLREHKTYFSKMLTIFWSQENEFRARIFKKSLGARHRVGIGLLYRPARGIGFSYRPARLHRLAEFIPWHQFRGPINI